ncbi:MAG: hypothetical protein ACPGJH_07060 [Alphaproteobacteria bacterium]
MTKDELIKENEKLNKQLDTANNIMFIGLCSNILLFVILALSW